MTTLGYGQASGLAGWIADTAACVRFFSRLPIPKLGPDDDPGAMPNFVRGARAMPLAGAIVALPAALILLIAGATALPETAVAVLALITLVATGGGLHEDGLADVADGFFGAQSTERRLEIMKDSRIGAFGVLALVLALGLAATLIAGLAGRHGLWVAAVALVAGGAVSRAAALIPWNGLPCARPEGLAALAGQPDREATVTALVLAAIIALPLALLVGLSAWLLALAFAGVAGLGMGLLASAKIDGHTGDVIGAAQQTAMLAFLAGLLILG